MREKKGVLLFYDNYLVLCRCSSLTIISVSIRIILGEKRFFEGKKKNLVNSTSDNIM